jgi:hypothetical protein
MSDPAKAVFLSYATPAFVPAGGTGARPAGSQVRSEVAHE